MTGMSSTKTSIFSGAFANGGAADAFHRNVIVAGNGFTRKLVGSRDRIILKNDFQMKNCNECEKILCTVVDFYYISDEHNHLYISIVYH